MLVSDLRLSLLHDEVKWYSVYMGNLQNTLAAAAGIGLLAFGYDMVSRERDLV